MTTRRAFLAGLLVAPLVPVVGVASANTIAGLMARVGRDLAVLERSLGEAVETILYCIEDGDNSEVGIGTFTDGVLERLGAE